MSWKDRDDITERQREVGKENKLYRKEQIVQGYKKDCKMFNPKLENRFPIPECIGLKELNCIDCKFYKKGE